MNKSRLEALSDGVFAIAMTLLVFNIKIPTVVGAPTTHALLVTIVHLTPVFVSYGISFLVLAMFWMSHNFFYNSVTKTVNRALVLINMLYLALIALIPFSAGLLGAYYTNQAAVILYGVNILLIGLVSAAVLRYAIASHDIDTSHVEKRLLTQAKVRGLLTPFCALLGIVVSFATPTGALLCFGFPIVFNLTPGTLDFIEHVFRLNF